MRQLYKNNPMNMPRLNTDKVFADYETEYKFRGFIDEAFEFIEDFQLLNPTMWERFVRQFREEDADYEGGWHGLNSSSLLEPIVRLHTLTDEKKYFDFAKYIVDAGGSKTLVTDYASAGKLWTD